MDLKEYCSSLTKDKLSELAIRLCDRAYPIWSNYCDPGELSYQDTIVGISHTIEKNILSDALELCHHLQTDRNLFKNQKDAMLERFLEPITALQDADWVLPYPVERVFYAIYNLVDGFKQKVSVFGELVHYLSVNQAVDAIYKAGLMTPGELKKLIYGG